VPPDRCRNIIILRGGTLIDGTGRKPFEDAAVSIEGTRVTAVCKEDECEIPKDAKVVSTHGQFVIPGLMDLHVHLNSESLGRPMDNRLWILSNPPVMQIMHALRNARSCLEAGFTTIRSMSNLCGLIWDPSLRDAIEMGIIQGPRILASGNMISGIRRGTRSMLAFAYGPQPSVIGYQHRLADGPDECRKAVREVVGAGADFVKIMVTGTIAGELERATWVTYTRGEIEAIADEAHHLERKVAAHAYAAEGILNALEAGVDTLEHGMYLGEEACNMMVRKGIFLVPTLSVLHNFITNGMKTGAPAHMLEKTREGFDASISSFKAARQAGVKIACGTDSQHTWAPCGENSLELELMVKHGMSEMEAIVAATKTSAEAIGRDDTLGTIEPGKFADILILDASPLDNIGVLRQKNNIKMIVKNGKIVVNRTLDTESSAGGAGGS
jgi:imidazolonepropionase-like amidohydrolase